LTRAGSQRYFCIACAKTYTPQPKAQGHAAAFCQQAVAMRLEDVPRNKVARLLQVAPQSVGNWCQQAQQRLENSRQRPLAARGLWRPEAFACRCQTGVRADRDGGVG
jgi:transposase-like protein